MTDDMLKKALLVEDNSLIRKVAGAIIAQAGFEVDFAMDGGEAVDKCRENAYDLVLMDMFMPTMNGDEATRLIRNLPPPANTMPILATTASDNEEERNRMSDAGVNHFLNKPFTLDQLIAALSAMS